MGGGIRWERGGGIRAVYCDSPGYNTHLVHPVHQYEGKQEAGGLGGSQVVSYSGGLGRHLTHYRPCVYPIQPQIPCCLLSESSIPSLLFGAVGHCLAACAAISYEPKQSICGYK